MSPSPTTQDRVQSLRQRIADGKDHAQTMFAAHTATPERVMPPLPFGEASIDSFELNHASLPRVTQPLSTGKKL